MGTGRLARPWLRCPPGPLPHDRVSLAHPSRYNDNVKRVRTTLFFLILGAVSNIVVAIACFVLLGEQSEGWNEMRVGVARLDDSCLWSVWRLKRPGFLRLECRVWQGKTEWDDRWESPNDTIESWSLQPSDWNVIPQRYDWQEMASGWPCLAMWTRLHIRDPLHDFTSPVNTRIHPRDVLERGLLVDRAYLPRQVILPTGVIWTGFVFNSLFYALLFPLFCLGLCRVRRSLRRHRGLCGHCSYDLRGAVHEVCPECGSPTGRRRASASVT